MSISTIYKHLLQIVLGGIVLNACQPTCTLPAGNCIAPGCVQDILGDDPYDYGIMATATHCDTISTACTTSAPGTEVFYHWPMQVVGTDNCVRTSAISGLDQIFTLPFDESNLVMKTNGWLYQENDWHYALDYSRADKGMFRVLAAAPGVIIFSGWDDWSGNTVIISHDANGIQDAYRTIYMHLVGDAQTDCDNSWNISLPIVGSDQNPEKYEAYLKAHGCKQNRDDRNLDPRFWGTDCERLDNNLVGRVVNAGDFIGFAGSTGPGGSGYRSEPNDPLPPALFPNNHLHIFFCHRDILDNRWYFFDPYGTYGVPQCYPPLVDQANLSQCQIFSPAWKGGKPSWADSFSDNVERIKVRITTGNDEGAGTNDIITIQFDNSAPYNLDNISTNEFERNSIDEFIIIPPPGMHISQICNIKIVKSPFAPIGDWEFLKIEVIINDRTILSREVNTWLRTSANPASLEWNSGNF